MAFHTKKSWLHRAVLEEQLQHLAHMGVPAYLSNIIIALIISYVYWQREPFLATSLSVIVMGIIILRYQFFCRFKHTPAEERDPWYWSRLYYLGSLLSGITWGIGLFMFANYLGGTDFFIILMAGIIVSATGFISFYSHLRSLYLFFYPLMIPITLSCFYYYNSPLMIVSGIMLTIYMIMAGIMSYKNHRHFVHGIVYDKRLSVIKKRLQASNDELRKTNIQLSSLSATDSLTGIANRRYFEPVLQREFQQAIRESSPLVVMLIDIDYFKLYNDHYGHLAGDKALAKVAHALRDSLTRPIDLVARYGGEEFVVVLPQTAMSGAINIAERIQSNIYALRIKHDYTEGSEKYLTLSIGISQFKLHVDKSYNDLIHRADKALYSAKAAGRNCYIAAN
ncbi:MAG: GGDEF domain-containing protein [Gammaproteobacteria bacterium]|nr:GGDEF domain-containing protein [Gammaproteobacteria bacterium]